MMRPATSTKRAARVALTSLFLGLFSPVRGQDTPSLSFIHISDTHVCNLDSLDGRFVAKRRHFGNGWEKLGRFLESVPVQSKADAVVITGDLLDYYEAQATDGTMRSGEIEAFARIARSSKLPIWAVPGNHDVGSYWFEGTEYLTGKHNAQKARAAWIRNIPCFQDGTWYSTVHRIGNRTYRLIFLDNGNHEGKVPGELQDKSQLEWLEWQLRQGKGDTNLLFMHIPLPVGDTNGDGKQFNTPPAGWPFPDTYKHGLMKILDENPSVKAILVGHQHMNVIEEMPFPAGHRIAQIQTGNLQVDAQNWRLVRLTEDSITVSAPGKGDDKVLERKLATSLN